MSSSKAKPPIHVIVDNKSRTTAVPVVSLGQTWQYKVVIFDHTTGAPTDAGLTALGAAGWELVSISPVPEVSNAPTLLTKVAAVFKKPT